MTRAEDLIAAQGERESRASRLRPGALVLRLSALLLKSAGFLRRLAAKHSAPAAGQMLPYDGAGAARARMFAELLGGTRPPVFLALGGRAPHLDGARFHGDPGVPCDGVVLLGRIEAASLAAALDAGEPAAPIGDFGENVRLRSDFSQPSLTDAALGEMKQRFMPIWRRLSELPAAGKTEDREALLMLRFSYSRAAPIEAAYSFECRSIVRYPLIGPASGARARLELLADLQLLNRRHFARTNTCKTCNSARLNVYEACPSCGGANLKEEEIVQHYRCGCQEPESHFTQGELLICPKCRRVLRHFGVDYGKPGRAFVCLSCGSMNSQPSVRFACLDCGAITPSEEAKSIDWWSYDMTPEGVAALRSGSLPRFEIASLLERRTRAYAPRDFALLAMQEIKQARRYKQPFAVIRFSFPNIETLRRQIGFVEAMEAFDVGVDTIVGALRDSDFVGVDGQFAALAGLPGTTAQAAGEIANRIRKAIIEKTKVPIELTLNVAEGDAATELLDQA